MKYEKDYYRILGVGPSAAAEEIRRAYRRLAILTHPDRNPAPQAAAHMREINEAYGVLGDRRKRAEYDSERGYSAAQARATSAPHPTPAGTAANLQQVFAEKENLNPVAFFALGLFTVIPFLIVSDLRFVARVLGALVFAFLIFGAALWFSAKSREKEDQCPLCGRPQAAERLGEKIMGVFRNAPGETKDNPEGGFFTYEKLKIHCKCKYCSYEWLLIKTIRL